MDEPNFLNLSNKVTRLFYFCQKGLGLFNTFKDLILVIIAICFALKLTSILWMLLIFILALPAMTILGWFCVHHMDKVTEWLQVKYGTHYQVKQFALFEEMRDLLKKICDR